MAESEVEVAEPPKIPRISVNIVFGPHKTREDAEELKRQFKSADIFIPEAIGWDTEELTFFRNISAGIQRSRVEGAYSHELLDMLFKSNKPIALIDIPSDHPLVNQLAENKKRPQVGQSFPETLNNIRDVRREYADLQSEREKYMLSQLKPRMRELLTKYPSLRNKPQLNILMSFGTLHTAFYHSLISEGLAGNRIFAGGTPAIYGFSAEGIRRYRFGKEIDDELAAKIFIERFFSNAFSQFDRLTKGDSSKDIKLQRKIISCFSLQDAEEMFNRLKRGDKANDIFRETLRKKDIYLDLPGTEKEMDEFLSK